MEFFIIDLNVLNLLYDKNKGTIPFTTKKTQKLWRNITSFNQRSQFRKKKKANTDSLYGYQFVSKIV